MARSEADEQGGELEDCNHETLAYCMGILVNEVKDSISGNEC